MATRYPANIDNNTTLPTVVNSTAFSPNSVNILRDAIVAIETEAGVNPAGVYSTIRARLDAMEAAIDAAIIGDFSASGDLSGNQIHQTVIGLQTNPIKAQTLGMAQDGYILTWVQGEFSWQAQPINFDGSALTLTGDANGAASSNTVNKIHGATVPAAGSLTTGNTLQVSSSSALTYGPLNLAGGANYVSGVLPVGNQAAQTMGGDISGTTAASTVTKIQGHPVTAQTLNGATDGYLLTWDNADGYWKADPSPVSFMAGGDLSGTATSQTVIGWEGKSLDATTMGSPTDGYVPVWVAGSNKWKALPNSISSGAVSPGTAGQIFVTNATPSSAWTSLISYETTHGRFTAGAGGEFKATIGGYVGAETTNGALYLLANGVSPSGSNPAVFADTSNVFLNATSGSGIIGFIVAGSTYLGAFDAATSRMYVGGSYIGSAAPLIVDWASANQTQIFAGTTQTSLLFGTSNNASTTITVGSFAAVGSDIAPGDLTLSPQQPYVSAATNIFSGNVVVDLHTVGSPAQGPFLSVRNNTIHCCDIGEYASTGYAGIWFRQATPGSTNWSFLSNGSDMYLNAPLGGGSMYFGQGASYVASLTSSHFSFGSVYSNAQYLFDLSSAAVQHFTTWSASATIQYDAQISDVATAALTIKGQGAYASASTHVTGGALDLLSGAATSTSYSPGSINVNVGSKVISLADGVYFGAVGATNPATYFGYWDTTGNSLGALWFSAAAASGNQSQSNYALLSDGSSFTILNAPTSGTLYLRIGNVNGSPQVTLNSTNFYMGGAGAGAPFSFDLSATAIQHFTTSATTAKILYDAQTSDVATAALTIQGQYAYASATGTNRKAGNVIVDVGPPTNSLTGLGSEAVFEVSRNTTTYFGVGGSPASPAGQAAMWLGPGVDVTDHHKAILIGDGSTFSYMNVPISGSLAWIINDATFVTYATATDFYFGDTTGAAPIIVDWTTSTTPKIQSGTSATSFAIGTNKSGATFSLQSDAASSIMQLAGGSQTVNLGGTPTALTIGSHLATVGHARLPAEFAITAREPTNTYDQTVIAQDSSGDLWLGAYTGGGSVIIGPGTTGGSVQLTGSPIVIDSYNGGGAFEIYSIAMNLDWGGGLGGFVNWDLNNLAFHNIAPTPIVWQYAAVSDVATVPMTIRAQYAYASATVNVVAGNLAFDIGAPISGNTHSLFEFQEGASTFAAVGYSHFAEGHLWLGQSGLVPSDTNPAVISNGTTFTAINVSSTSGVIAFFTGNANTLAALNASTSIFYVGGTSTGVTPIQLNWSTSTTPLIQSGTSATSLTVGTNNSAAVLNLQADASTTILSLSISGPVGLVQYASSLTPTFSQADLATNSGTGATLTIHAQNETGSTSVGGNLVLASGTGTSTHGTTGLKIGSVAWITGAPVGSVYRTTINGYEVHNLTSKGTDYTINSAGNGDHDIWMTASCTITLPTPEAGMEFRIIVNYNPTSSGGTIARHASELINGAASNITLSGSDQYSILQVASNGTDWVIKGGLSI